jgi:hypothetical protein
MVVWFVIFVTALWPAPTESPLEESEVFSSHTNLYGHKRPSTISGATIGEKSRVNPSQLKMVQRLAPARLSSK